MDAASCVFLADETRSALPLEPGEGPQLAALDRVRAWSAILDPPDVEHRAVEVDLVPTDLGRPEAVPVGQQDHGGVAVTVSVALRGLDECLDLVGSEVFAGTSGARRSSAASERLFVLLRSRFSYSQRI
jgi:hypothetical protein